MPQEVFYHVDSNKLVKPVVQVIQSTQSDSDSEIGSKPQEADAPSMYIHQL